MIYPSEWAAGGWVILNIWPGHVLKIKANGDSLTQLTYTGSCFAPILNDQRTQIGFHTTWEQQSLIIDLEGNYLDTLEYLCGFRDITAWCSPDELVSLWIDGLELNNITTCSREVITPFPPGTEGFGAGLAHLNGTDFIWSCSQGIYRTDLIAGATRCLRPTCNSSYFAGLSYDPFMDRLAAVRMDFTPNGFDLEINSTLVLMTLEGEVIEEVDIQW